MAVVLMEGFDHYVASSIGAKLWSGSSFQPFDSGRLGGQCITLVFANPVAKQLPSSYSTLVIGCAAKVHLFTGTFLAIKAGGNVVATVGLNTAHRLRVTDSASRTFDGTTIIPDDSWFYVEVKIVKGSAGSCELHLNGGPEIASAVGNFGTVNMDSIQFENDNIGDARVSIDDVYVLDTTGPAPENDFLGDVAVRTLYPVADGTYSQWTADPPGPHYEDVNETLIDGDGTIIYDTTPGDKDSFDLSPLPVSTVYAAQLNLGARKGDAGSTRQIEPLIRQAGVDHVGPTFTLSASYVFYSWLLNQDPTGAAWTGATINADEFGVELVA